MITREHYTANGRHPEDVIFAEKTYINRLQDHIDEAYNRLATQLNLNETGNNLLFDYVLNEDHAESFEEWLAKLNTKYSELTN
jgi:oligoribonuclease NrnB/cAMP/cGMP phosphodiesterase (DHH superfamily)